MTDSSTVYWATKPNSEEIVKELNTKVSNYDEFLSTSGLLNELKDSYSSFYGDSKIRDVGQQGELKAIKINHYASLIRNLVSLVTNNKPAWQPIASNTDVESQSSAILASGLLDFYMKDRRLDRKFRDACLMSCFLRESWISAAWDVTQGEIIAVDNESGSIIHEGDLKYNIHNLTDVIRDYNKKSSEFDWLIVREQKNRYDLISQFPELADQIKNINSDKKVVNRFTNDSINSFGFGRGNQADNDNIDFYTFYHKQCASLPNGRMIQFSNDVVFTDGTLPYNKIPIVRLSSEETFNSCFGHSPMMDVLPVQKALDSLASILLTNNASFGVQNITIPISSGISVSQLGSGLNVIEYDKAIGKPEPLQLTASSPETYNFFSMLVQQSQLLSGVNDAVRGESSAGTSGAALALLSQQAIQFANGLQQGYVALIEDVGTLSIQILQKYANTKRVAVLTGKNNRPLLKEWSASNLQGISRITIESGNALSKTSSGRLTIADSLLQSGMIQRPEQYISVLTTGQLEPIYENEQKQLLLIRDENEKLAEGVQVRALLTDDHDNHILEHASVLSNPEVRANPNSPVVVNTLAHIQEHLSIAQSMPPALAMLLKQQPLPQPMPPQSGNNNQIPEVTDSTNPITQAAQQVNQPNFPKDLINGGTYNPGEQNG